MDAAQEFGIKFLRKYTNQPIWYWQVSSDTKQRFIELMKRLKTATTARDAGAARDVVEEVQGLPGFPHKFQEMWGTQGRIELVPLGAPITIDFGRNHLAKRVKETIQ